MNESHFTSDPRVAYMSGELRRRWDPANDSRFRRWTRQEFELYRELFKADEQMVGMMFRAGVPLLAGTDVMNPTACQASACITRWPCSSNPALLRSPPSKPPRCAVPNLSAAPMSLAGLCLESAPTSSPRRHSQYRANPRRVDPRKIFGRRCARPSPR